MFSVESQLVSKVGVHCVSIAVEKLFLKIVLHFVSSTVVQCLENVGTRERSCVSNINNTKLPTALTLFDDGDMIVLSVTVTMSEVRLTLQSEVVSQDRDRQGEQEVARLHRLV